jgi:hypothetical protein
MPMPREAMVSALRLLRHMAAKRVGRWHETDPRYQRAIEIAIHVLKERITDATQTRLQPEDDQRQHP